MDEIAINDTSGAKRAFSRVGLALFVLAAVSAATQIIWVVLAGVINGGDNWMRSSAWGMWLGTFLPLYAVAVPAALLLLRRAPAQRPDGTRLGAKNFFLFLLICFPVMYGGNIIGTLLSQLFSGGTATNALEGYIFDTNPLKIVVVVFLAPLIEEYLFRKQLIDRTKKYGEKTAILFSALAFGLFHMNLFQFFYAFGIGLVFGYVYTRTGRLRYPVALHMILNFMGSVIAPWVASRLDRGALGRLGAGDADARLAAYAEMLPQLAVLGLYTLMLLGLSIAGLVILIIQARKLRFVPQPEALPRGRSFSAAYLNPGMILYALLCLGVAIYALIV